LIEASLLNYFCQETGHDVREATLWSDSTVALHWILNYPNRWKTFVGNRVTEVQTNITLPQLKHCPGQDDPADYLSRGVNAEQLKGRLKCLHGPSWLSQNPCHFPRQRARRHHPLPDERTQSFLVWSTNTPGRLIDSSRFSSCWKLLRFTSLVLRFVRQVRLRSSLGELDASELAKLRKYWTGEVQKDCFGPELQVLRRGSPYRVNYWQQASTPFSKTSS
jgi:hypothetical protein